MKKNHYSHKAFTLVELIVGVTISMLLMFSVSVFVGNWIKNITSQKTSLENDSKVKEFTKSVYESINFIDKSFWVVEVASGILYKVNKDYDKWGFSYIWSGSFFRYYCLSWSESETTSHIYIKTFIPFEWERGDMFSSYNFNSGTINTNMFSGSLNTYTKLVWPTDVTFNSNTWYVSDTLGHSIYSFNKVTLSNFQKIVWKEVFWNEFSDWDFWTWVFLNNPTWLEYADIWWTRYLFISDTLNDRILYQNLSDNKVYKLLWREDWLKEPTGIYYDDSEKTLYIANSGKKQILTYSSSWSFVDTANIDFSPKSDIKDINKLGFSFYYASGVTNPSITISNGTWSFSFTNLLVEEDLYEESVNKWIYHFTNFISSETPQVWCNAWEYKVISWNPVKCTDTWTGIIWDYVAKTFTWWENYSIKINDIWPEANFSDTWAYYIWLNMFSWSTVKKTYYFPYFSKTDNDIFTKSDNILKILTGWLGYPTWIYASGSNLVFNDFLNRKTIEITKTWSFVSGSDLNNFDFSKLGIHSSSDNILYTPVKNYDIGKLGNLLNIYINYYKNYSCYNLEENRWKTKEFILKKSLK